METFDFESIYYPVNTSIFCSFWFVVTYFVIHNFSQNQKGFGCIVAAVLLIFSPKELI